MSAGTARKVGTHAGPSLGLLGPEGGGRGGESSLRFVCLKYLRNGFYRKDAWVQEDGA